MNPLILVGMSIIAIVAGFIISYALGRTVDKKKNSAGETNGENK